MVSPELIEELKEILQTDFQIEITNEEAEHSANTLVESFDILSESLTT